MSEKRKKILDTAMKQLKKTREQMDPAILKKIRGIIASNPKVMKGLGIDKMPEEKKVIAEQAPRASVNEQKALDIETLLKKAKSLQAKKHPEVELQMRSKPEENQPKSVKSQEVKIDQAQNMEVLAKLMQLKPSEIENIKSVILKNKN